MAHSPGGPAVPDPVTPTRPEPTSCPAADTILVWVVFVGVGVTLGLHLAVTASGGVTGLDQAVSTATSSLRRPTLLDVASALTQLGGTLGLTVLATVVLGLLALRRHSWEPVVLGAVAGAGSAGLTSAVKALTGRARPPMDDVVLPQLASHAFPSGHTLSSLTMAGITAYLLASHRRTRAARARAWTAAALFALVIAVTRLYLGRHWATDVLAGWSLGAAWLALVVHLHHRVLRRRHPPPHHLPRHHLRRGDGIGANPAQGSPRYWREP